MVLAKAGPSNSNLVDGQVNGQNSGGSDGQLRAELVKRQVALILAYSTKAALAAKTVTSTTPIIFLADDPVATGLVDSLNRPGGNLTGAAGPVSGLIAKRIEILRELFPMKNL